jgi:hypothetical protein
MHMGFNASNVPKRYPTHEEVAVFYDAQEEITVRAALQIQVVIGLATKAHLHRPPWRLF